jgi:hypothetical protein
MYSIYEVTWLSKDCEESTGGHFFSKEAADKRMEAVKAELDEDGGGYWCLSVREIHIEGEPTFNNIEDGLIESPITIESKNNYSLSHSKEYNYPGDFYFELSDEWGTKVFLTIKDYETVKVFAVNGEWFAVKVPLKIEILVQDRAKVTTVNLQGFKDWLSAIDSVNLAPYDSETIGEMIQFLTKIGPV